MGALRPRSLLLPASLSKPAMLLMTLRSTRHHESLDPLYAVRPSGDRRVPGDTTLKTHHARSRGNPASLSALLEDALLPLHFLQAGLVQRRAVHASTNSSEDFPSVRKAGR